MCRWTFTAVQPDHTSKQPQGLWCVSWLGRLIKPCDGCMSPGWASFPGCLHTYTTWFQIQLGNKKLLGTSASLLVTNALLLVTRSYYNNYYKNLWKLVTTRSYYKIRTIHNFYHFRTTCTVHVISLDDVQGTEVSVSSPRSHLNVMVSLYSHLCFTILFSWIHVKFP